MNIANLNNNIRLNQSLGLVENTLNPIYAISGLIVDLNENTMLNSSGSVASNGEAVATWLNAKTGNGVSGASQNDVTKRPIMQIVSGNPEIKFDGSNDFLSLGKPSELNFQITDDWTIIAHLGSVTGNGPWYHKGGSGNRQMGIFNYGGYEIFCYGDEIFSGSTNVGSNEVVLSSHRASDRQIIGEIENITVIRDTNVGSVVNTQNTYIGCRANNTSDTAWAFFYGGSIRRLLVYNKILTIDEKTTIYNELKGL